MHVMVDPRDLASALKRLRGGRTQREVAKRARIDPGAWSAYEKGLRYPRHPDRLRQIAHGLGVDLSDLQNAILQEGALRLESRAPVASPSTVPPEAARPPQEPGDVDEIQKLVKKYAAELSLLLEEILLLLVKGRPSNS